MSRNGKTAEQVIAAIEKSQGFASAAATALGVSRSTFYRYLDKYATAKQTLEDVREKRHDYVESKLMKNIEKEKEASIFFYLKTQCKDRGYVERSQHEHSGKGEFTIRIIREDGING